MVDTPPDIGPQVRAIVRKLLTILGPLLESGAALIPGADAPRGRCQQTWCPACAVAAVAAGEQHPLVMIIAEHGATLLAVLQSASHPAEAPSAPAAGPVAPPQSRYQPIPVTIQD
ncbi:hypothetical protein MMAD_16800 [Mycolicibacterium madagascariense]|uniref:Uncharacterized protein n=1 Tax=Mycolicibacterium madagascariense TaxID=212765 RepID=A0A7I7XDE0_9MYCO|nr:hypothetical protein [Mycolicibacterium madagascariense]MCV7011747.1 hypothetical protein [Mycolicibacterium madagascariense]BBZ27385.1 hypothetical protein MMAD_16800 [Mycolicibacterium madagascariense]